MFSDRLLTCKECGESFFFTAGEQAFYEMKDMRNVPGRCPECRERCWQKAIQEGLEKFRNGCQSHPAYRNYCS